MYTPIELVSTNLVGVAYGGGSGGAATGSPGGANTGGGAGGCGTNSGQVGGTGGSGVVIISYNAPSAQFTGGTVTSYTDANSVTWQVHTFTSNGSLVPK